MKSSFVILLLVLSFFILTISGQPAFSHCDTRSGPVITDAKEALNTGNVNLVLIWVKHDAEETIRKAFQQTIEVRKTNPKVQELADNYFFETLVRIHRQGEGAPYTGIKDDDEIEPPIQASDKALETGTDSGVLKLLNEHVQNGVTEKFKEMFTAKSYDKNNIEAGREFVEKYVVFMHYVEGIYNATQKMPGHGTEHTDAHTSALTEHKSEKVSETTHPTAHDTTGHLLIIGGTLLILTVQLITSRKGKNK